MLCSQTKTFTIKVAGFKMGNLDAYHVKNNDYDLYVTHSVFDFSVLIKVKADVKTEAVYYKGVLIKSTVNSILNGTPYSSKTVWKTNHYDIDCHTYKYNYTDTTLTKPIKWSAGRLYFDIAPVGDEVYTESYGKLGVLTKTGNHAIKMTSPDSKQIYYYNDANTEILKIEVINNIKNFEMYPDNVETK